MRRHTAISWPTLALSCALLCALGGCNDVLGIREPSEQVLDAREMTGMAPDAGDAELLPDAGDDERAPDAGNDEPLPDAGEADGASPGQLPAQTDAGSTPDDVDSGG